ncbi:MAG: putative porin [Haliea sp.]|nr:putative porin [Haliea sp.]
MKRGTALAGLLLLSAATAANAAVSEADLQQLQQKLEQALNRIDQLEQRLAAVDATQPAASTAPAGAVVSAQAPAPAPAAVAAAPADQVASTAAKAEPSAWTDRIRIEGDFRYRFQNDDKGDPIDESRDRNRIRARPLIIATLDDELQVGFGLATGENNDPVSTMQTLGDGGSDKEVTIDLAYFDWTGIEDTSIRGGRFKNTFLVVGGSQLQWDSDWRPEGTDIAWNNGTFFAQGAGVYLESDSNQDNEEFSYILQTGAMGKLGPLALTGGVGYTDIGAADKPCFYNQSSSVPGASNLCQR